MKLRTRFVEIVPLLLYLLASLALVFAEPVSWHFGIDPANWTCPVHIDLSVSNEDVFGFTAVRQLDVSSPPFFTAPEVLNTTTNKGAPFQGVFHPMNYADRYMSLAHRYYDAQGIWPSRAVSAMMGDDLAFTLAPLTSVVHYILQDIPPEAYLEGIYNHASTIQPAFVFMYKNCLHIDTSRLTIERPLSGSQAVFAAVNAMNRFFVELAEKEPQILIDHFFNASSWRFSNGRAGTNIYSSINENIQSTFDKDLESHNVVYQPICSENTWQALDSTTWQRNNLIQTSYRQVYEDNTEVIDITGAAPGTVIGYEM